MYIYVQKILATSLSTDHQHGVTSDAGGAGRDMEEKGRGMLFIFLV